MGDEPNKDGVDKWPTVEASDWREAIELGGEHVTYYCADGWTISFGGFVKPRPNDPDNQPG